MFDKLTGVEMALHIERTSGLLSILGIFLITSCVDKREAVPEESDAEKNLAAIRELLKLVGDRGPIQSRRSGGDTRQAERGLVQGVPTLTFHHKGFSA